MIDPCNKEEEMEEITEGKRDDEEQEEIIEGNEMKEDKKAICVTCNDEQALVGRLLMMC